LLASDGKVAGVIRAGIPGAQIAQAIPANVVKKFLSAVSISMVPPKLELSKLDQPVEFRADAVALMPGSGSPSVQLILDLRDGPTREFPMALKDGAYWATAVPVPPLDSNTLAATAQIDGQTMVGTVADAEIFVDGKTIKLSQVRRLELGGTGNVILNDKRTLSGPIAGLEAVQIQRTDSTKTVNLAKVESVDLVRPSEPTALVCTAVASVGGKEVSRSTARISLTGAQSPMTRGREPSTPIANSAGKGAVRSTGRVAPPSAPWVPIPKREPTIAIAPANLESEHVTRRLPDECSDVCVGAGGRYLLFLLPKQNLIALFDVSQTRIVH
jgi:hypothetical protein